MCNKPTHAFCNLLVRMVANVYTLVILLLRLGSPWFVCEVVLVPYVDAVVEVTVMHALLFVLDVSMF